MPSAPRALLVLAFLTPELARAQGSAADFTRAEGLRDQYKGTVVGLLEQSAWIDSTPRVWYRRRTSTGDEFVVVDASTRQKRPAFDHVKLAAALSTLLRKPVDAASLPFTTLSFSDHERTVSLTTVIAADTARVRCTIPEYVCTPGRANGRMFFDDPAVRPGAGVGGGLYGARPADDTGPRLSPDRKWEAVVRNFNVYLRPAGATKGTFLSTDGSEGNAYFMRSLVWSPDSRRIAVYRVRPGYAREVRYVESSPADQLQPRHMERFYSKPGDALDQGTPVLFDVNAHTQSVVDNALFPNAYDISGLAWRRDGRAVTFEYNQRGHQLYRVIEIDAATARPRVVIEETSPTFFEYSAKKFRFDIADGKEVVWMSERDGWNHLYLYDARSGAVKNQITRGEWVVQSVTRVDDVKRCIWFNAGGIRPGQDPYYTHCCRVNFDGSGLVILTEGEGQHTVSYSPDESSYLDTYSRIDLAPVTELRRSDTGRLVCKLEEGDASEFLPVRGGRWPERFVAKGRDGKTDIYGVIVYPSNFDPAKKYPVIENIYAGPQGFFTPKAFRTNYGHQQRIADAGAIVVQCDGMGTSGRSKAFHDVCFKNLRDGGFPDRIAWMKAAALSHPQMDLSRVGIYGGSAGGQNAMAALLWHHDFYSVACADCGCHDNRMDKIWWNEQWMGWPVGKEYETNSNAVNAALLEGKLMLIVGELDSNVDPSSTLQVVGALEKANKDFELLIVVGANHGAGETPYGSRRRLDFLTRNLITK